MSGDDFPSIVDIIVDSLAASDLLPKNNMNPVRKLLLKKHKHTIGTTIWDHIKHSAAGKAASVRGVWEGEGGGKVKKNC